MILTVYFANKTSPFIQRALFKSPFIGQIMRDLRDHHGVRREVRIRELLFTCAIVLVTLIMVTPSVFTYATIAVMATLSLYLIFMIPVIDENEVEPSNANDVRSIILPIRFPANEVGWQTGI